VALLLSYAVLITLYFLPVASWYIVSNLTDSMEVLNRLRWLGMGSPLMSSFWVPLVNPFQPDSAWTDWRLVGSYFLFSVATIAVMFAATAFILERRIGMTGR
jgi:hypothetical protein